MQCIIKRVLTNPSLDAGINSEDDFKKEGIYRTLTIRRESHHKFGKLTRLTRPDAYADFVYDITFIITSTSGIRKESHQSIISKDCAGFLLSGNYQR